MIPASAVEAVGRTSGLALAVILLLPGAALEAQKAPVAAGGAGGFASVQGVVFDSVHNKPLVGAMVSIDGTQRHGLTTATGRFRIDSIPPGSRNVVLTHPLLDTIGIVVALHPQSFVAGETTKIDLSVPPSGRIVAFLCPATVLRARGPGALVGFVRNPETGGPATGAKVQLVYEESDVLGSTRASRVREAIVDSTGAYRICGLPTPMSGKVQVLRDGSSSGEIVVTIEEGSLGLRSLGSVPGQVATMAADSGGPAKRVYRGSARVVGEVFNTQGQPIAGARVTVQGSGITAITRAAGDFVLDSLPAGTQSLEVRKLGYGATEHAVELLSGTVARVRVTMADYLQTLKATRVEANRDKGLADVGYLERKFSGQGYYIDGDRLRTDSPTFSEALRTVPGLRIVPAGDGLKYRIQSSRDPSGCVSFYVDGTKWAELSPGDIDDFVRPEELRAIEIYTPTTVPAQFQVAGQSTCTTVVIWTVRKAIRSPKE